MVRQCACKDVRESPLRYLHYVWLCLDSDIWSQNAGGKHLGHFLQSAGKNIKHAQIICAFVVLAFLLQSFIPTGFMPGTTRDGKVAVVICSGMGEKTVYVDPGSIPGDRESDHPQHLSVKVCPYFSTISWSTIDSGQANIAIPVNVVVTPVFALQVSFASDFHYSGHSPRGPPASV